MTSSGRVRLCFEEQSAVDFFFTPAEFSEFGKVIRDNLGITLMFETQCVNPSTVPVRNALRLDI